MALRTWIFETAALLLLVSVPLISTLCPKECNCQGLKTYCSSGGLQIIPHFLNPRITTLKVTKNQVEKLEGSLNFYSELENLDLSSNKFNHLGRSPFIGQVTNLNLWQWENSKLLSLDED